MIENLYKRQSEIKLGSGKSELKTGLVIQGGSMRSVYSIAALYALQEAGLNEAFDTVWGASAGALNGAYYLSGQALTGVKVFIDDISTSKFANIFRLNKVLNIDYLIDDVLKSKRAIDIQKLLKSHSELKVILMNVDTARGDVYSCKDPELDIYELFRASVAIPILFNNTVNIKGKRYIDGGVIDGIPILKAIEEGCTDIMVVITRPLEYRSESLNWFSRSIGRWYLRKFPEAARNKVIGKDTAVNEAMDLINNIKDGMHNGVRISVIFPSDKAILVPSTSNNRQKLIDTALMARNDARKVLGLDPLEDNPFE